MCRYTSLNFAISVGKTVRGYVCAHKRKEIQLIICNVTLSAAIAGKEAPLSSSVAGPAMAQSQFSFPTSDRERTDRFAPRYSLRVLRLPE